MKRRPAVFAVERLPKIGRIRYQLLDRREDAPPHGAPLDVPGREQLVRPLRCPDRRVVAVLVDEELGRTPNNGLN